MSVIRRTLFAAPAAPLAAAALVATALVATAAAAVPAFALPVVERTLFTWNGRIDREVMIVVRGRNVETRAGGVDASFAPRLDVRDALPRQLGDVDVRLNGGRGSVEVVQQPSARNDYAAIVRVRDPRSGSDDYRVVVSWQGEDYAEDDRNGNRDRDRDRADIDDRDRDRNKDRNKDRDKDRDRDRPRDDRGNNGRGNGGRDDRGNNGRGNGGWDNRGGNGRDVGLVAWRGDVDDVVDIRIQGRRIEYRTRSGQELRNVRYDVRGNGLPRRPVTIELDVSRGRGDVIVVQQPNRSNDFTAIVRVVDRRSGYGDYNFDLRWY